MALIVVHRSANEAAALATPRALRLIQDAPVRLNNQSSFSCLLILRHLDLR
jgi:hypothetical protein